MAIVALQVRMPWTTDAAVGPVSSNTFHFDSGGDTPTTLNFGPVGGAVIALYNTFDGYWSSMLTGDLVIAAYNLSDAIPRLPFANDTITGMSVEADTLPPESSFNIGYRYARASGVPTQRGRGTMHFGPLAKSAIGNDGLLTSDFLDNAEGALNTFKTALAATVYDIVTGSDAHGWEPLERFSFGNDLGIVRRRDLESTVKRVVTF